MKERTFKKMIFAVFCCQFLSIPLFAQQQKVDTTHTYSIPEITVSDIYQTREVRSTAPLQVFSKDALKNLHALQVSDAVKHFAGVTVKDYGGIGGLKTVSIRSLGAQHTAVGYDGITLTDCQTGQIDIGRFSLDNVDQLSLSNGQSDNIFQPARFFAAAGILNIQTLTPRFEKEKTTNISASFKTGSWGLVNPSILLEQQLNSKWTVSANGEWYELAGSEYNSPATTKNYTITYYRPSSPKEDVKWTDNKGNEGYVYRNDYHTTNSYYPAWIKEDQITFHGSRLKDNTVNEPHENMPEHWVGYCYAWGYADNHPNGEEQCKFKIDWAVDKNGNPVVLDGIDFVRIYTAVNQNSGWMGEISTELQAVEDLHFKK